MGNHPLSLPGQNILQLKCIDKWIQPWQRWTGTTFAGRNCTQVPQVARLRTSVPRSCCCRYWGEWGSRCKSHTLSSCQALKQRFWGADEGFWVRMRGWHWMKDRSSDFIWWPIGKLKSGWLRLGWGYRRRCLTWLRNSCLLWLMSPTPRWTNFLSCEEETLKWDRNIEIDNKERQVNKGHRVQDAFYFYQLLD